MVEKIINKYEPDYVSPPGETLSDILDSINMSQASLSERTGRPRKTINEIIKGKTRITPETALQLEKVLGIPASFWNNREKQYREFLAKEKEKRKIVKQLMWLSKFPVKEMIKFNWIKKTANKSLQVIEILKFFGIAKPKQWERIWYKPSAIYRKSKAFESNPFALSAWLRQGEIEAQKIDCKDYNSDTFETILHGIRALTNKHPDTFIPKMMEMCAKAGVAVVFVPEIKGARVSGATRWLYPYKALIQLSLRYKWNDHLWFTFFHEAGHIMLHGKRELFIEGIGDHDPSEKVADRFSANLLIDNKLYNQFVKRDDFSRQSIITFANQTGIAPGIIVGRLQHDKIIGYSYFNDLKVKYIWVKGE